MFFGFMHGRPNHKQRVNVELGAADLLFQYSEPGEDRQSPVPEDNQCPVDTRHQYNRGIRCSALPPRHPAIMFSSKNPRKWQPQCSKMSCKSRGSRSRAEFQQFTAETFPTKNRRPWKLLAEHQSPPLIRALEIINKKSQNLHAEMLLRTLGAEFKGAGTNEAGLQVVKEFLVDAGSTAKRSG